jgi:hypothetical protein
VDVDGKKSMNTRQAKEILALYKPGDTNLLDPRMAEALELTRKDPDLAVWFGQHCASLVQSPPSSEPRPSSTIPKLPSPQVEERDQTDFFIKGTVVMVVLAVTALAISFLWSLYGPGPQNTFPRFRDRMARLVQRSYPMKIAATDQTQIRQYFSTNSGPVDFVLPKTLEKLPGIGAAIFTWHNERVSLMGLDAGGGTNLFLFLVKRNVFPDTPLPPTKPEFNRVGRVMTGSWTMGDYVYLLTGPTDEAGLRNYLE